MTKNPTELDYSEFKELIDRFASVYYNKDNRPELDTDEKKREAFYEKLGTDEAKVIIIFMFLQLIVR